MRYILLTAFFLIFLSAAIFPAHAQEISFPDIYMEIRTGHHNKAVSLLNKYIRQNPDSIKAYILLGKVHLAIGGINNRTAAEKAILNGLRRDPKNADLLKFLAKVKVKQNMPGLSTKWLERALHVKPLDQKALDQLLDFYIRQSDRKKIENLRPQLEENLKKNPENPIGYISLGKLETYLEHPDTAVTILEKGLTLNPDNSGLLRALYAAYLFDGQADNFTETYFRWMETEKDANELSKEYEISALTMSEEEAEKFHALPFQEKPAYLIRYWRNIDPYPVSIVNERLIEHVRRVLFAKERFHTIQGTFGFDDRGKVYIRYGEPKERFANPVPFQVKLEDDWETLPRGNESWYYPSYGWYMAFDFVTYGGGYYHEVPTLTEAIPFSQTHLNAVQRLYGRRSHLGGIYSSLAYSNDIERSLNEYMVEKPSTKHAVKPRYEIGLDMPKLDFIHRTAQFRGDSGRTRIELAYGVPLKQLEPPSQKDSTAEFSFHTDFILFDSLAVRRLHASDRQQYLCLPGPDYAKMHFTCEEKHEAAPGPYKLTFQVLENSRRMADFKVEPLTVRDFSGSELMISDLKFSRQIDVLGTDSTTGVERFSVSPYPFKYVKKEQTIFLYFEIYNLLLEADRGSRYRVSLNLARRRTTGDYIMLPITALGRIFSHGKPQVIETVYERETNSQTAVEYVELDLSDIQEGFTRLTVIIEDLVRKQDVQVSIEFELRKK